nr:hypothetical protein [Tanacetum cinerariifolium]
NKESVKDVVVGGGEFDGRLDEINLNLSDELADNGGNVIFKEGRSVTACVAEGGRMVLCYVQGSGRRKRKKGIGCGSKRQENYGSGRRDCGRIRIWDPGIKIYFRHHLEDKVVVKEWGMIRPRIRIWDPGIKIYFRHHLEDKVETVFRFYQRYELTKGREATSGYTKSGNGPPALQGVRIEPLPGRTGNNISTFGRDRVVYVSTSPYIVEDGIETYNP